MTMRIRDAVEADMQACVDLYNALIDSTTIAWTETKQSLDERLAWFANQQQTGQPVVVADDDGNVVGFAAYGTFRGSGKWPGYRFTVEHTIHVDRSIWGRGVGRLLIQELIDRARHAGVHVMIGAVDADNRDSIKFHEQLGFVEVARMPEVGRKFDRWLDLVLMQRIIDSES